MIAAFVFVVVDELCYFWMHESMKMMKRQLYLALVTLLAAVTFASPLKAQDPPPGGFKNPFLQVGNSGKVSLTYSRWSEQVKKGRYTLVFFWASWSDEARQEAPYVQSVHNSRSGRDLTVLGVPYQDEISDSIDAMTEWGMTFSQLVDVDDDLAGPFGLDSIPFVVLLGPDGEVVASGLHGEEIRKAVTTHL